MRFVRRLLLLLFMICTSFLFSQDGDGTGDKKPKDPDSRKEMRKKDKKKWKAQRKLEKDQKKAVKRHHKRIQTKKTRKRMKKNKRKAQRNHEHKGEFFLKKWFTKKKKT